MRGRTAAVHAALAAAALAVAGCSPRAPAWSLEQSTAPIAQQRSWSEQGVSSFGDDRVVRLALVSQTWRGVPWRHDLPVIFPSHLSGSPLVLLYVTGDGDGTREFPAAAAVAEQAGIPAAVLTAVPNQPLFDGKQEDALVAYTFDQFLKSGDGSWPLLFPMVRAARSAMDALTEFFEQRHLGRPKFILTGASKRGWTSWLTAAADSRVAAIAPMVFDFLNMPAQVRAAQAAYGKQSDRIREYTKLGLVDRMGEPRSATLRAWVDPYSYRTKLTMPKLLLLGTNDPYWVVDSLACYWSDLPAPKAVFYLPNGNHSLRVGGPGPLGPEAKSALAAWVQMLSDGESLPSLSWASADGKVTLKTDGAVVGSALWEALSPDRDLRNDTWEQVSTLDQTDGVRSFGDEAPPVGYRARMGEVTFEGRSGEKLRLSTLPIVEGAK